MALDNRTFETLSDFGVKLVAAPKDVMSSTSAYVGDDSVENIGNHREPNLELLSAADPDLVIVGQRFAKYYEQIKELLPNATIVYFSYDVSEKSEHPGDNLINGFKESTLAFGEIFEKQDMAKDLVDKLDNSIKEAKEAYKGQSVMSLVVSGGDIGYSAPKSGRVWGPLYEVLGLKPSLQIDNTSSDHKGDDISVEAIAESNPHYLLVLDRDQATSNAKTSTPAKDVINNSPALQNLDVVKNNRIYYAPDDTYTNESIQTFTKIFEGLKDLFQSEK
ncbi:ABC transporter substrate-binding protein [uncultured Anaerococcus sp.]|uniref:siderophore ABC transporter substrate-binding protein n=1 Tax=uncultured Anaerococcus sp. TaxID=293428 RepID=UPI00288BC067|nr:ABC transporter substrate-binding protein [uncultured Anaerococcus sp.]